MAKIIKILTYDLGSKESGVRYINTDQVIEIKELTSYDSKSLTKIKLLNDDFVDTQLNISDTIKLINGD